MKIQKNTLKRFDSIPDFLRYCDADNRVHKACSSETARPAWAGTESLEEAVRFATVGGWEANFDQDLMGRVHEIVSRAKPVEGWQSEDVWCENGVDDFDADAFHRGELDICFMSEEYVWGEGESNVVTILVDHSYSGNTNQASLASRGLALIALVRCLQAMGKDLEIWSEITSEGDKGCLFSQLVCLKKAGELMDPQGLEFAIGNTSWLRRLFFAAQEMLPKDLWKQHNVNDGYGRPRQPVHADTVGADMVLSLKSHWGVEGTDIEGLERWLGEMLDDAGVSHGLS